MNAEGICLQLRQFGRKIFTITETAAATKGDKNNELKRPAN